MNPRYWLRHWPVALLAVFAAVTSWLVWHWREPETPAVLVGPPRSDYRLETFELIALDDQGQESFAARGPRLDRHPSLGTLDIEAPEFSFPTDDGRWHSTAKRAWVARDGGELQLLGDARVIGPAAPPTAPVQLAADHLTVYPKRNQVETDAAVTITEPGSILRARGLRADLAAHHVELLSEVRIHHEPAQRAH